MISSLVPAQGLWPEKDEPETVQQKLQTLATRVNNLQLLFADKEVLTLKELIGLKSKNTYARGSAIDAIMTLARTLADRNLPFDDESYVEWRSFLGYPGAQIQRLCGECLKKYLESLKNQRARRGMRSCNNSGLLPISSQHKNKKPPFMESLTSCFRSAGMGPLSKTATRGSSSTHRTEGRSTSSPQKTHRKRSNSLFVRSNSTLTNGIPRLSQAPLFPWSRPGVGDALYKDADSRKGA